MGEQFCISCSKILDENRGKLIEETLFEILQVIFDNSNHLEAQIGSKICENCEEKVMVAFRFKGLCIYTNDRLHPYISHCVENDERFDLKMVYAKERQCEKPNYGYICRLCLELVDKSDKYILIDSLKKRNLEHSFNIYLPEVNLEVTKDPIICKRCLQSLDEFMTFRISIDNILKIVPLNHSNNGDHFKDNQQDSYIKHEAIHINSVKEEEYSDNPKQLDFNAEDVLNSFEIISNSEMYRCKICFREFKKRANVARHMCTHTDLWFKCKVCSYMSKGKKLLKNHEKIHDAPETEYKCNDCEYKTKFKPDIRSHKRLNHSTVLECHVCGFKTKYNRSFRNHHYFRHTIPDKYKCVSCSYKTTRIDHLKKHLKRAHPDTNIYKCSLCTYKTKLEKDLNRHMFTHEDNTEVKMYQCYNCGMKTKYRTCLLTHMKMIHTYIPEEQLYKCRICSFVTKRKAVYDVHMVGKHRHGRTEKKNKAAVRSVTNQISE